MLELLQEIFRGYDFFENYPGRAAMLKFSKNINVGEKIPAAGLLRRLHT